MSRTVSLTVDTTVDVDVDMSDFEDFELIEEIEARGYIIYDSSNPDEPLLSKHDCEAILERVGWDAKPGSDLDSAISKIKSLYYGGVR
jgi:hypothetical protein